MTSEPMDCSRSQVRPGHDAGAGDPDAVGELVGLLEVLGGEEDRHAELGVQRSRLVPHRGVRLIWLRPIIGSSRSSTSACGISDAARS